MKKKHKEIDIADRPLTAKEFASMKWMRFHELPIEMQNALKSPGRPVLEHSKEKVTIRLDHDLLAALRARGKGWQTQMNALLREAVLGTSN